MNKKELIEILFFKFLLEIFNEEYNNNLPSELEVDRH